MSKYAPLQNHLAQLKAAEWNATFSDVENIINGILPKSAYEYQAWWSNNAAGHSHARSWVEAGWKTEGVNIDGRRLIFRRVARSVAKGMAHSKSSAPVWGLFKGTVTIPPETDLTEPSGNEWTGYEQ